MNSFQLKVVRVGEPELSLKLDEPELAVTYWRTVIAKQSWFDEDKEHMVVILLSTRYNVKGYSLVSIGTCNESLAHPREVFRVAIASAAYGFIVMHNHPSGDPGPSTADSSLTRRLKEAAELLQIKLLDHIIVGAAASIPLVAETPLVWPESRPRPYFSFKEAGIL